MFRVLLAVILLGLAAVLIGCQTLTETPQQSQQRYSRIVELNRLMLNADIDAILLMDRPSYLTPRRLPVETIK